MVLTSNCASPRCSYAKTFLRSRNRVTSTVNCNVFVDVNSPMAFLGTFRHGYGCLFQQCNDCSAARFTYGSLQRIIIGYSFPLFHRSNRRCCLLCGSCVGGRFFYTTLTLRRQRCHRYQTHHHTQRQKHGKKFSFHVCFPPFIFFMGSRWGGCPSLPITSAIIKRCTFRKRSVSWGDFQKCVEKIISLGYDRGEYLENPVF